ncbi:hypothetical protein, partial [Bacteroides stercoris]|uniref:hypothetical protein n=1 Tax=Bacteroides stercoris TaxID=46506 RepID=UPI0022E802E7
SHAGTLESRFRVGKELAGSALIRSITLFNLQSESNRSNRFKIQFAHQNIRHLCCRIFFIHKPLQKESISSLLFLTI